MEHPILVHIMIDLHKYCWQKQTIWWSAHIGSIFSWSKSIIIEINKHVWFTVLMRFVVFSLPRDELSIDRMFYKVYIISNLKLRRNLLLLHNYKSNIIIPYVIYIWKKYEDFIFNKLNFSLISTKYSTKQNLVKINF